MKLQNFLIVAASYLFYGWWDWRFLSLILFSTIVDYLVGIGLLKQENLTKRKILLWTSIIVNLGFLGFFKYYNFFLDNFITAFSFFGTEIKANSLNIILPVGISFYTFQTLSYSIDVYKRKLEPTKDFIAFSAFVSFFPQLVAGPIERATHLLPQFYKKRTFDYSKAVDGMRQILWGLFKKIVIADNCAEFANQIFNNSADLNGSTLVLGALFFTFQIYGDFSGYSDIAIGTSRLFGFDLMRNFNFPYFSRNIAEFWRRWHISLSTWFRDYLYIPLGGSRGGTWMKVRNTFIIFLVSGFWHGANWTFIIWGFLNALYIMPSIIFNTHRNNLDIVAKGKYLPTIREFFAIGITFCLTVFAWIFFRAANVTHALSYISEIFSSSLFTIPYFSGIGKAVPIILLTIIFLIVEWLGREQQYAIAHFGKKWYRPLRWSMYYSIILAIFHFAGKEQQFIYFQF
ncbi:MAG TPA: MBOAT family O-acyltransferase [Edaphocola sp.]|nr:MBOAT family O-acyltransferase [Edaphocola sp.]